MRAHVFERKRMGREMIYPKLLVTSSLLSSWLWLINCYDGFEESAKDEFMKTLSREPFEPNEAMQKGIQLENDITAWLQDEGHLPNPHESDEYESCIAQIAEKIRGSQLQVKASKDITISGQPFLLYGRVDALRGEWIYDIKYTGKYEVGKYFESPQHKVYFEILDSPRFAYLVCDGKEVYEEPYLKEDTDSIIPIVEEFWSWLQSFDEYKKVYVDKWKSF